MNTIDFEKINNFRREVILAHETFTNHPEWLNTDKMKGLYSSLLSATTKESLKEWQNAAKDVSTDALSPIHVGGVYHENVLKAVLVRLDELNGGELDKAAEDISNLVKSDFKPDVDKNIALLKEARAVGASMYTLALFREGNGFFAFNNDAERIFETKGWLFSEVKTSSDSYLWIDISNDGLKTLEKEFQKIELLSHAADVRDFPQNTQQDNAIRAIANVQQSLEYLQNLAGGDKAIIPTPGLKFFTVVDNLYEVEHQVNSIVLDKGSIQLIKNDGAVDPLMEDGFWFTILQTDIPFSQLNKYLTQNSEILKEHVIEYSSKADERRSMGDNILTDYSSVKQQASSVILFHKANEDYIAYGNDAIKVADALHVPLWQMEIASGKSVPVAIVSSKGYGLDILDLEDMESKVVTPKTAYDKYSLPFELSPLNVGLQSKAEFENASVFKMKNGEYAIRASLSGNELENKTIPTKIASQYMSLPYGEEKEAALKTILVSAYKSEISKEENRNRGLAMKA